MFLKSLFRRSAAPEVAPQLEAAVAQRLAAEGKDPSAVSSRAAAPLEVPPKPDLGTFRGEIRLELTLDATGLVKAVTLEGAPLDRVAELESWAHGWRFEPAILDGHPHACRMVYEVTWS